MDGVRQERPRGIPEHRGMPKDERPVDEKPYTADSYAAQYGISVEEAETFIADSGKQHGDVIRRIHRLYQEHPERRREAIQMLDSNANAGRGAPVSVEGWSTAGELLKGALRVAAPKPARGLREQVSTEGARKLAESLVDGEDEEFWGWLNASMARGDHGLRDRHFHLDDVREELRRPLLIFLAMRFLEHGRES
jgi:hypothetical protein